MVFEHLTFVELHVHESPDDISSGAEPKESRSESARIPRPSVAKIGAMVGVSIGVSVLATILAKRLAGSKMDDDETGETAAAVLEVTE